MRRRNNKGQFIKELTTKNCLVCDKKFQPRLAKSKTCSRSCSGKIGGKLSKPPMTQEWKGKISKTKLGVQIWNGKRNDMKWMNGENNHNWKGDEVGYHALHDWIRSKKGKANKCLICGTVGSGRGKNMWANISGEYKRDIKDYASLCPTCHKMWDTGRLPVNLWEMNEKGGCLTREQ